MSGMPVWNCYARNYFLGDIAAPNAITAINLAAELWKKYNLVPSEVSVIIKEKDRYRHRVKLEACTDYRVKYPC